MQYNAGDKVNIHIKCRSYKGGCRGKKAVVEQQQWPNGRVGVRITGMENKRSKFGLFWLLQEDVCLQTPTSIKDNIIKGRN